MIIKCKYDNRVNELLIDTFNQFISMKTNTARVNIILNPNNML